MRLGLVAALSKCEMLYFVISIDVSLMRRGAWSFDTTQERGKR